jgi:hypothetical protein
MGTAQQAEGAAEHAKPASPSTSLLQLTLLLL